MDDRLSPIRQRHDWAVGVDILHTEVPNVRVCTLVAFTCLAVGVPAYAARQPSLSERKGVTAALPQWVRAYPVGCMWLQISVANAGGYAKVTPVFLSPGKAPCTKYVVGNGYWIVKKQVRWRVIYEGSELPFCKLHVPHDLSRCIP